MLKFVSLVKTSNVDKKTEEGEAEVLLCNYVDVYKNECINNDLDFMVATASPDEIKKFKVMSGDVIITKDSEEWEDIAIPAYVVDSSDNLICGYHLALIRPDNSMFGKYLFRAFQAKNINTQFRVSANGITRYGLSKNSITSACFPIPSYPEQKAIADFLDGETTRINAIIEKQNRLI